MGSPRIREAPTSPSAAGRGVVTDDDKRLVDKGSHFELAGSLIVTGSLIVKLSKRLVVTEGIEAGGGIEAGWGIKAGGGLRSGFRSRS